MSQRHKILIVDDIPENIQVLLETLRGEYTIIAARDGKTALRLAESKHPDLILLDVMMPGMDGYEVCLRLKSSPETWDIPVIFVTALGDDQDEARGLTVGGVDYITKPFTPELVQGRVRSQLELKLHKDRLEELVEERTKALHLTQDVTILTLASLAESRDPETGGHIIRTQSYVRYLAEKAAALPRFQGQLTPEIIELLYKSAPLHDVGKVGISDDILLKPGKLTKEEFDTMKQHAIIGWEALHTGEKRLGSTSFLKYAAEIALTHHEKWDGSGYPNGVAGDEIPLSGRLMAIADVYDALISHRVYKKPFSHAKAVSIIAEGRERHFDPDLTDLFIEHADAFRQIALEQAEYDDEREALQPVA
ncbi:MAG: two-component system response regulator [Magnetococcales bacterium]|nr:two-component system response regulator [Magnetococcales bacterium]